MLSKPKKNQNLMILESKSRLFFQFCLLGITKVLTFLSLYAYAGFLSEDVLSEFVYLQALVIGIVALISLQIPAACFRFSIEEKYLKVSRVIASNSRYLILLLFFFVLSTPFFKYNILLMALMISLIQIASFIKLEILRSVDSSSIYYKIQLAQVTFSISLAFIYLIYANSYIYFVAVYTCIEIFVWLFVYIFSGMNLKTFGFMHKQKGDSVSWSEVSRFLYYGLSAMPAAISWWVLTQGVVLVARQKLTSADVATYAIANRMPSMIFLFALILLSVLSRNLTMEYESNPIEFKKIFTRYFAIWIALFVVISLIVVIINNLVLERWYPQYLPMLNIQIFQVINAFLLSVFSFAGYMYIATKKVLLSSITASLAAVSGVAFSYLFVNTDGLFGIIYGMTIGISLALIVRFFHVWKLSFVKSD